ncbi:MAG: hypothetical protein IKC94_01685 [Lentisphaeria bacterium]|nr:hypothetical protein [Lentisphaeria bacterium]
MKKLFDALVSSLSLFYAVLVLTYLLYTLRMTSWTLPALLIIIPALLFYPFILTVAAGLPGCAAILAARKLSGRKPAVITGCVQCLSCFVIHCLLLLDAGLYFRYGYHINPHVMNIFTTPGGFAGMGMENSRNKNKKC